LICTKESKQIDAETKLLCRNAPENQKTQQHYHHHHHLLLLLLFLLLFAYQESGSVVFIAIQNELDERWCWQLHLIPTTTTTTTTRRSMMMTMMKKKRIITRLMICKTEICALCASTELFPISYCFSTIASRLHNYGTAAKEKKKKKKKKKNKMIIS
jgi:hypothetical protein